uniref:Uncharacterized protein n=1 Tax=Mycolicibacterium neoaurum VKM Ac-1815D TaxID=700508 RepID=V5XJB7_MYCNE
MFCDHVEELRRWEDSGAALLAYVGSRDSSA